MKKKILLLSFSFILILGSCKKDDTDPAANTPSTNVPTSYFTWSTGSLVTADSAHFYNSITTIYAFKYGLSNSVEINLSSLNTGTYIVSPATGNDLTFVTAGTTYTSPSGTVTIYNNSANKLTGSFSASLSGGTLTTLSGTFKDIPGRN